MQTGNKEERERTYLLTGCNILLRDCIALHPMTSENRNSTAAEDGWKKSKIIYLLGVLVEEYHYICT